MPFVTVLLSTSSSAMGTVERLEGGLSRFSEGDVCARWKGCAKHGRKRVQAVPPGGDLRTRRGHHPYKGFCAITTKVFSVPNSYDLRFA